MKSKVLMVIGIILFVFLGFAKTDVNASATLYITPSSGTFYRGNNFTVGIYVSSTEEINAVEVTISYDSSKLSIISCGAVTSTFELVADSSCPTLTLGTTGSYSGGGAQVGYVTFRGNSLGSATVSVSGRTAMDGSSVSTSGVSRTYSIAQYNPIPSAPSVISASHPDNEGWYKERLVELSWNKEEGGLGFSYILDQAAETIPDNIDESSGTGVDLEASDDGIWYLHIKARSAGGWGATTHYKIQIDSIPPTFVEDPTYEDQGDLQPEITFEAEDDRSGIDYYEISIDGGEVTEVESPYKTAILSVGDHSVTIKAYDLAGNYVEEVSTIMVGELRPPTITELIIETLFLGPVAQRIIVRGTAPSEAKITIHIQSELIVGEAIASEEGTWEYIYEGELTGGEHVVRAMTEIQSIQSAFSEEYAFHTVGSAGLPFLPRTGGDIVSSVLFVLGGLLFGFLLSGGIVLFILRSKIFKKGEKEEDAIKDFTA